MKNSGKLCFKMRILYVYYNIIYNHESQTFQNILCNSIYYIGGMRLVRNSLNKCLEYNSFNKVHAVLRDISRRKYFRAITITHRFMLNNIFN